MVSNKLNLYDTSNIRKIHRRNISRIGGAAIFLSFLTIALAILPYYYNYNSKIYLYFLSALIAFAIGFIDDIRPYSGKIKLFMQFICAGVAVSSGILVENINLFGNVDIESGFFSAIISIFMIVLFMNAINLIDGMDGIAAGIVFTVNIFICILGFLSNNPVIISISLIICGALSGFFIFNYPPAKIFLGDGGAYFLGFLCATLPMTAAKSVDLSSIIFIIPLVLMILPLTDLIYVAAGRIQAGRSIFFADKTHLHHRLMRLGLSNRKILFLFMGFTAVCGLVSLLLYRVKTLYGLILLFSIFFITGIFYYILKIYERKAENFNHLNPQNDIAQPKDFPLYRKIRKKHPGHSKGPAMPGDEAVNAVEPGTEIIN